MDAAVTNGTQILTPEQPVSPLNVSTCRSSCSIVQDVNSGAASNCMSI